MKKAQTLWEKIRLLAGREDPPRDAPQGRSVLSQFATPHTFTPNLSPAQALVAIAAFLARVFGACVLFAAWGTLSGLAWSAIGNHFWRAAAVLPLVLLFVVALATLMIVVSRVERAVWPRP